METARNKYYQKNEKLVKEYAIKNHKFFVTRPVDKLAEELMKDRIGEKFKGLEKELELLYDRLYKTLNPYWNYYYDNEMNEELYNDCGKHLHQMIYDGLEWVIQSITQQKDKEKIENEEKLFLEELQRAINQFTFYDLPRNIEIMRADKEKLKKFVNLNLYSGEHDIDNFEVEKPILYDK